MFLFSWFHFQSNRVEQSSCPQRSRGWVDAGSKNQDTGKDFHGFIINCPAIMRLMEEILHQLMSFFSISYRSYTSHVVVWDFWTIHSRVSFELPFAIDPGFWLFVVWGYTSPGLYRDYNKLIKGSLWTNQSGASSWFCTLFSWKNASKDEAYTSSTFMKDTFLTPACFMGI